MTKRYINLKQYPKYFYVCEFLLRNQETNVITISKKLDITYSYTHIILNTFNKNLLIFTTKKGRQKIIKLTPKGISFSSDILKIMEHKTVK